MWLHLGDKNAIKLDCSDGGALRRFPSDPIFSFFICLLFIYLFFLKKEAKFFCSQTWYNTFLTEGSAWLYLS